MQGRTGRAPALPACAILLAVTSAFGASAAATTPSLLWIDAKQLAVSCLVQSYTTNDAAAFEAQLCGRVRSLAGRGAPFNVRQVQPGDRAFISPDTVVLLVHASVERSPRGRTVAFAIRPYRPSGGEAEVYFGAAPRAVAVPSGTLSPALDSGLRAALSELLPWQQQSSFAKPL